MMTGLIWPLGLLENILFQVCNRWALDSLDIRVQKQQGLEKWTFRKEHQVRTRFYTNQTNISGTRIYFSKGKTFLHPKPFNRLVQQNIFGGTVKTFHDCSRCTWCTKRCWPIELTGKPLPTSASSEQTNLLSFSSARLEFATQRATRGDPCGFSMHLNIQNRKSEMPLGSLLVRIEDCETMQRNI